MTILGLIPARGGSKGLPGKNIKPLGGIPLIGHTITTAKQSGCLDRLWVSTDDPVTAEIARRFGVPVPWLRPKELAADGSMLADVLLHLLERLGKEESYRPDAVMVLQPTSPFRKTATIIKAIEMFQRYGGETVISVTPARNHPYWCYRISRDQEILEPFVSDLGTPPPRQKFPEAYFLDGSIYLISSHTFFKNRSFFDDPIHPLIVPSEEAIDIDTPFDWEIAAALWSILQARSKGAASDP